MNTRFLLAPVAAFAILTFAAPVSAQDADPQAEFTALRRDSIAFDRDLSRYRRNRDRCQPINEDEVLQLAQTADEIALRATALAPQLATNNHARALNISTFADAHRWWLVNQGLTPAEQCYVPPAE